MKFTNLAPNNRVLAYILASVWQLIASPWNTVSTTWNEWQD
jgi:hypothetical protein